MGKISVAVICVYTVTCVLLVFYSQRGTGSHYIYPLDDTYIHMAMAKHLAESSVFGVTRSEYSSSSSAPLWGILMAACFKLLGPIATVPLFMSFLSGLLLLGISGFLLKRAGVSVITRTVALLSIFWCTPMTILTLSGMEHLLHAALTICIVWAASRVLTQNVEGSTRTLAGRPFALSCVLIAVAVLVRVETIFVAAVFIVALLLRRQLLLATLVSASAGIPLAAAGLVSVLHGWFYRKRPVNTVLSV